MTPRTKTYALLGALAVVATAAVAMTLLRDTADAADEGGEVRRYFIQAEEVVWDYAPDKRDRIAGRPFDDDARVFVGRARDRVGSRYTKALYRGYTDASFATRLDQGPQWAHLGMLGPVLHAEVGDTIEVVYIRSQRERTTEVTLVERPELQHRRRSD